MNKIEKTTSRMSATPPGKSKSRNRDPLAYIVTAGSHKESEQLTDRTTPRRSRTVPEVISPAGSVAPGPTPSKAPSAQTQSRRECARAELVGLAPFRSFAPFASVLLLK